jgi:uncharacterized protein (TIGR00255 family)
MIESMTGYGQGETEGDGVKVTVEVRSVNNRFLDQQIRLPRFLHPLESRVRETAGSFISRGKLNLSLTWEQMDEGAVSITVDLETARELRKLLEQLKTSLDLEGEVRLEHLMNFSEIFQQERQEWDPDRAWSPVEQAVRQAMEQLRKMRRKEGRQLEKDMVARLDHLEELLDEIESSYPDNVREIQKRLRERISELIEAPQVDEQRLAMEVAILAEKADITEECVRFRSHIKLFRQALEADGPVGRKLNFLLQELNREANTMTSKANDVTVAHRVVEIKEDIERIREQVQNVE